MKRILFVLVTVLLALSLIAAELPPALPSSFWGTVIGYPVNTRINARMDGKIRAYTNVINDPEWGLVYALDVPGDPAVDEGKTVVFKTGGVVIGTGTWHSGTNVQLNLSAPARKR